MNNPVCVLYFFNPLFLMPAAPSARLSAAECCAFCLVFIVGSMTYHAYMRRFTNFTVVIHTIYCLAFDINLHVRAFAIVAASASTFVKTIAARCVASHCAVAVYFNASLTTLIIFIMNTCNYVTFQHCHNKYLLKLIHWLVFVIYC